MDSQPTNFNKVREFHEVFEHPIKPESDLKVFDENPKLVQLRMALIEEEVKELKAAFEKRDMVEVGDALSDILYVVYGAGLALGIDLDKSFDIVHKSNMTKACETEEQAKETVEFMKKNYDCYKDPQYRKSKDGKYWIVYDASTGKILKSKFYTPANLKYLGELPKN